jgi:hypothetical protein
MAKQKRIFCLQSHQSSAKPHQHSTWQNLVFEKLTTELPLSCCKKGYMDDYNKHSIVTVLIVQKLIRHKQNLKSTFYLDGYKQWSLHRSLF